jgi:hypothetical protein
MKQILLCRLGVVPELREADWRLRGVARLRSIFGADSSILAAQAKRQDFDGCTCASDTSHVLVLGLIVSAWKIIAMAYVVIVPLELRDGAWVRV